MVRNWIHGAGGNDEPNFVFWAITYMRVVHCDVEFLSKHTAEKFLFITEQQEAVCTHFSRIAPQQCRYSVSLDILWLFIACAVTHKQEETLRRASCSGSSNVPFSPQHTIRTRH